MCAALRGGTASPPPAQQHQPIASAAPTCYAPAEPSTPPTADEWQYLRHCLVRFLCDPHGGMEEELWAPIALSLQLREAEVYSYLKPPSALPSLPSAPLSLDPPSF